MKRKDFLKSVGAIGLGSLIPWQQSAAGTASKETLLQDGCVLIPQETEGPYDLDLSGDTTMFRQDITEGNGGIPLYLTMTILNVNDNCAPIPNARVDIWHCNKDGYYSGFNNQPGYLGTQSHSGATFFRGIQLTDSNGEVKFTTIYPGWYPGRVGHIHFQVFISSLLKATSQLAFPESLNTEINNTELYSAHGQNSTKNTNDGVFFDTDNTQYQIVNIAEDGNGGYNASLTVGINAPATGVIDLQPETGGQFKLAGNYPNPFTTETVISFLLNTASTVAIDLFDLQGRKVMNVLHRALAAGEHGVTLKKDTGEYSLPRGSYLYQISVENANGSFRQSRLLTIQE